MFLNWARKQIEKKIPQGDELAAQLRFTYLTLSLFATSIIITVMAPEFTSRIRRGFAAALFILLSIGVNHAMAGESTAPTARNLHKVVFQVSDGDPKKWNLTLVNANNVQAELGKDNVVIEIVAYGAATDMLRIESEVGPRVDEAIQNGVRVVACELSMRGLNITTEDMLPRIHYTRSGVVYLMEKQEQGYAYIRP